MAVVFVSHLKSDGVIVAGISCIAVRTRFYISGCWLAPAEPYPQFLSFSLLILTRCADVHVLHCISSHKMAKKLAHVDHYHRVTKRIILTYNIFSKPFFPYRLQSHFRKRFKCFINFISSSRLVKTSLANFLY